MKKVFILLLLHPLALFANGCNYYALDQIYTNVQELTCNEDYFINFQKLYTPIYTNCVQSNMNPVKPTVQFPVGDCRQKFTSIVTAHTLAFKKDFMLQWTSRVVGEMTYAHEKWNGLISAATMQDLINDCKHRREKLAEFTSEENSRLGEACP